MTAVIDYDAGNVKSVVKAFQALGEEAELTREPGKILSADRVVLPGVGNFGESMARLTSYGLEPVIREVIGREIPFLGICVGLQLLFEGSEESPDAAGLGVFRGRCVRFSDKPGMKIPQIGWNSLSFKGESRLYKGIEEGAFVYFVHSYYALPEEHITTASCSYADEACASVERGNVFATQFHPEKSGRIGLKLLENFISIR
ncbi:MAG: imidazole glycerol phosphate synthase subunit HisH [Lachnospiraceae bacterium]|nr:imidazole glycerol phosphate synthase subunit HisH [Lachnospiraceae bacterium]